MSTTASGKRRKARENGNETHLGQGWGTIAVIVGVNEVGLSPKRPKARLFELRPPLEEGREVLFPGVNFELELTKR